MSPHKKKTPSGVEGVHGELPENRLVSHRIECSHRIESLRIFKGKMPIFSEPTGVEQIVNIGFRGWSGLLAFT
jgi:hypothetical protein